MAYEITLELADYARDLLTVHGDDLDTMVPEAIVRILRAHKEGDRAELDHLCNEYAVLLSAFAVWATLAKGPRK